MKKVGKEVLKIACTEEHLRNGESAFVRLKDDGILHVYTCYGKESYWDDADAEIRGCISRDEGESWGEFYTLFPKDDGARNNMSASLIRLQDGALGICYLRKYLDEKGRLFCMPVFRRSEDEGKSWSEFCFCTGRLGYYCTVNDAVITLKNGKIIVPMAYCGAGEDFFAGRIAFAVSEDNGKTWADLPNEVLSPYEDDIGIQEPGLYEHEDGTLWLFCRTAYGHQYQAFSNDQGMTWSQVTPNFHFTSPDSPMRIKKTGDYVTAVLNPVGYGCTNESTEIWKSPKRTPLVCTVTGNDGKDMHATGKTFANGGLDELREHTYIIEPAGRNSACYPALIGTKDGFLVSYYHSGGTEMCLHDTKIIKVTFEELN